jgi:hypothetical protein
MFQLPSSTQVSKEGSETMNKLVEKQLIRLSDVLEQTNAPNEVWTEYRKLEQFLKEAKP